MTETAGRPTSRSIDGGSIDDPTDVVRMRGAPFDRALRPPEAP